MTGASGTAGASVVCLLRAQGATVTAADGAPPGGESDALSLPARADPSFCCALTQALREHRIDLLVPTVDQELPAIALARPRIEEGGCRVFISPSRAIRAANDRWWTYETLRLTGLEVPRSVCGVSRAAAAGFLPFPAVSFPRWRGSDRAEVVHERLEDLPPKLSPDRVYCERFPGDRYEVHLFAAPGGEAVSLVALAHRPSASSEWEPVQAPEIEDLARAVSRTIALEGVACIEIQRDRQGRARVLGVEARPGDRVGGAPTVVATLLRTGS